MSTETYLPNACTGCGTAPHQRARSSRAPPTPGVHCRAHSGAAQYLCVGCSSESPGSLPLFPLQRLQSTAPAPSAAQSRSPSQSRSQAHALAVRGEAPCWRPRSALTWPPVPPSLTRAASGSTCVHRGQPAVTRRLSGVRTNERTLNRTMLPTPCRSSGGGTAWLGALLRPPALY